jgi:hypothetical protein
MKGSVIIEGEGFFILSSYTYIIEELEVVGKSPRITTDLGMKNKVLRIGVQITAEIRHEVVVNQNIITYKVRQVRYVILVRKDNSYCGIGRDRFVNPVSGREVVGALTIDYKSIGGDLVDDCGGEGGL